MRIGRYWKAENFDSTTLDRIEKILTGEFEENIKNRTRENNPFGQFCYPISVGLPTWLACYIVYNRHSEIKDVTKWQQPSDIDVFLNAFKQHSLHTILLWNKSSWKPYALYEIFGNRQVAY